MTINQRMKTPAKQMAEFDEGAEKQGWFLFENYRGFL